MKRILLLLAVMLTSTLLLSPAQAQEPGDIGIFFDPAGTQTTGAVLPSIPYFLYIVAFDVPGDMFGYELSFNSSQLPGLYFVLSAIVEPFATATNFGSPENFIVGTGICYLSAGPTLLVTLQILDFIGGPDIEFCVGPSTPSSFSPATPGYVTCISPTDLRPFGLAEFGGAGLYPDGCAVGNATREPPIVTQPSSWGAVKSRF